MTMGFEAGNHVRHFLTRMTRPKHALTLVNDDQRARREADPFVIICAVFAMNDPDPLVDVRDRLMGDLEFLNAVDEDQAFSGFRFQQMNDMRGFADTGLASEQINHGVVTTRPKRSIAISAARAARPPKTIPTASNAPDMAIT